MLGAYSLSQCAIVITIISNHIANYGPHRNQIQENNCFFSSGTMVETQGGPLHEHYYAAPPAMVESSYGEASNTVNGYETKKKKMTSEQLKLLEISFQEEMKLDPDRKMKLSKELGLQPRQIAVWFQNRKARWKNKQLEHLYESLRQEFDVVCREKKLLQEEVRII